MIWTNKIMKIKWNSKDGFLLITPVFHNNDIISMQLKRKGKMQKKSKNALTCRHEWESGATFSRAYHLSQESPTCLRASCCKPARGKWFTALECLTRAGASSGVVDKFKQTIAKQLQMQTYSQAPENSEALKKQNFLHQCCARLERTFYFRK